MVVGAYPVILYRAFSDGEVNRKLTSRKYSLATNRSVLHVVNLEHSWWTFVFKILPEKTYVSWKDFKNKFKSNGGDSFYAAWSLSYLEPAMYGLEFKKHNIKYEEGICPVAESLQPLLVQLKTNYKDLRIAELQAKAIKKTIRDLS